MGLLVDVKVGDGESELVEEEDDDDDDDDDERERALPSWRLAAILDDA